MKTMLVWKRVLCLSLLVSFTLCFAGCGSKEQSSQAIPDITREGAKDEETSHSLVVRNTTISSTHERKTEIHVAASNLNQVVQQQRTDVGPVYSLVSTTEPPERTAVVEQGPAVVAPVVQVTGSATTPLVSPPGQGAVRLFARAGSIVRIEGTSNIHDWQVQGALIGGWLEVGPNFPVEPGAAVAPGQVQARVEAFIAVRSLKSVEKDGKPYSDRMDEIMYGKLLADRYGRILYSLTELTAREPSDRQSGSFAFDSVGQLVVAGVTNRVVMPVTVLPLGDKRVKISGNVGVKMTDFNIDPPKVTVIGPLITTGDEVTLSFEWVVGQRTLAASTPGEP